MQASLDESFRSLEKAAQVEQALVELRGTLNQLQPLLNELKKQRRFIVVEQES
ncbi:MAG: hypothetical protein HC890_09055 [Chloroflexaceae bacterium]|nr:hypothetical protein [Chloroflexaceae bacterium]